MPEPYRAAVYYAPEIDDPLWRAGCHWLGRDPQTHEPLPQPAVAGIAAATSSPRRYGFHATLKPPMQLAQGLQSLLRDVASLAAAQQRFALPPLQVVEVAGFLAICLAAPCPALEALAASLVRRLDAHRLAEDADRQRQRMAGRTDRQIRNVRQFGYPHVLEDWQFHMTLSNSGETHLAEAARQHFATALPAPRHVQSLAVFIELSPGAAFELAARLEFGGA